MAWVQQSDARGCGWQHKKSAQTRTDPPDWTGGGVKSHRGVAGCGAHDDFARGRHHAGQATQECAPATGQTLSVHVNQVHGEAARVYAVPRGKLLVEHDVADPGKRDSVVS